MSEEWRIIEGYPNYSVSNWGNVKNNRTHQSISHIPSGEYYIVGLRKHGRQRTYYVHRVVARAFIGDVHGYRVLHVNGDTSDNRHANLHRSDQRVKRKGRLGSRVRVLETNRIYESVAHVADHLEGSTTGVYNALTGYTFTYKGYHFEYVD